MVAVLSEDINREQFWGSGEGSLSCPSCLRGGDEMKCIYMTVTGAEVWHQRDQPNSLNVAISCVAYNQTDSDGRKICEVLDTADFDLKSSHSLKILLLPDPMPKLSEHRLMALNHTLENFNRWDPPNIHYLDHHAELPASVMSSLSINVRTNDSPLTQELENQPYRKRDAVCVTQTFRNAHTGPMLYMFVQHYLSLGWVLLIFDRFGLHKEFLQDFIDTDDVHYHPYTAYQLLYPTIYDASLASKQPQSFRYYSERGSRGFGKSAKTRMLENNEECDHDSDRRKTFILARQRYSNFFSILYPDRDEFLFCMPEQRKVKSVQRYFQHKHIRMLYRRLNVHQIELPRYAYSARYPRPDIETDSLELHRKSNEEIDIHEHLADCLDDGYSARNMSQLWHCFSNASMRNTKSKSAEVLYSQTCPFVGVHRNCLRCKCNQAISRKCHYIHLNTVYFKPHKIYEKYGNSIYEPLSTMVELWR